MHDTHHTTGLVYDARNLKNAAPSCGAIPTDDADPQLPALTAAGQMDLTGHDASQPEHSE